MRLIVLDLELTQPSCKIIQIGQASTKYVTPVMNPTAEAGGLVKESRFMTSISLLEETTFEES